MRIKEGACLSLFLETRDLTKQYGALVAVDHLNLKVEKGEFLTIIGANGAGKTTLVDLITGRQPPSQGEIYFKGENITNCPPEKIVGRKIARSFQLINAFNDLTVFDNVALAVRKLQIKGLKWYLSFGDNDKALIEKTDAILRETNLSDIRDKIVGQLPHGLRRVLELTIAMSVSPELIMLDEPLSGVPTGEAKGLLQFIKGTLREKYTLVMIEHKIDLIKDMVERMIVMHRGSVIADGTYSHVMKDAQVQKAYLGI